MATVSFGKAPHLETAHLSKASEHHVQQPPTHRPAGVEASPTEQAQNIVQFLTTEAKENPDTAKFLKALTASVAEGVPLNEEAKKTAKTLGLLDESGQLKPEIRAEITKKEEQAGQFSHIA
jgi:hypothetical protein